MHLVRPSELHLPSYVVALERGWSADNTRPEAAQEELARIRADARAFIASMEDREGTHLPPQERESVWNEVEGAMRSFESPGGFDVPGECLVGAATK